MGKTYKNEFGRSMVEMLGVLAITGILSVAGISFFSRAIDKNHANTIINEAQKRAVVIASQINMLGITPSIAEFTNNNFGYAKFDTIIYGENGITSWTNKGTSPDNKFILSITNVNRAICNQIKNIAGGIIQSVSPSTCSTSNIMKLVYNNDLSNENKNSCVPECTGDLICQNGMCLCPENREPNTAYTRWDRCCGINEVLKDNRCIPIQSGCTSNDSCTRGSEFCSIEITDNIVRGTCLPIGEISEVDYNGKNLIYNTTSMSWQSAKNWCSANNKKLVTLEDMECYTRAEYSNNCSNYFKNNFKSIFGNFAWERQYPWLICGERNYIRLCGSISCKFLAICEE